MGHIVHGVGDLAVRDRTHQPIREPVGLGQRDAEHLVDQARQRGRGEAQEPRDDLRVEHDGGHGAAGRHEHVEILRGRVGHRDPGAAEDGGQRSGVDRERVDEGDLVGPGDLNEGEVRDVGALGVELGVEPVELLARELVDQRIEAGLVLHHGRRCRRGRRHGRAGRVRQRTAASVQSSLRREEMDDPRLRSDRAPRLRPASRRTEVAGGPERSGRSSVAVDPSLSLLVTGPERRRCRCVGRRSPGCDGYTARTAETRSGPTDTGR